MGTHPIFESDFDCLTDRLSLIRKGIPKNLQNFRQMCELAAKEQRDERRRSSTRLRTRTTKSSRASKKLSINPIPGIEEVNSFRDDGSVIHFTNPKVQASPQANTFAISGQAENKQVSEMLPNIVNQLGPEGFASLRKLAMEKVGEEAKLETPKDDDVPELEGDFEEASKQEEAEAKTEVTETVAEEPVEDCSADACCE